MKLSEYQSVRVIAPKIPGGVVGEIFADAMDMDLDLDTAEGRADLDDFFRDRLRKIERESVRDHAAEIIRDIRARIFFSRVSTELTAIDRVDGGDAA